MAFAKPLTLTTAGAASFEAGSSTGITLSASSGNPTWTPSIDAQDPMPSYSFAIANVSPGLEPSGSKASWVFKAAQPGTYKFTAVVTDA